MREIVRDDDLSPQERSQQIVQKAEDLGLQPYDAPEPLPPIQQKEVKLVCWMAVVPAQTEDEEDTGPSLISQQTLS
jgi:hypothetical protein